MAKPTRRARLRSKGQIWGRRAVLAGLAVIGVAILGGLLLILEDDDGDDRDQAAAPVATGTTAQGSDLGETFSDAKSGISLNWPSEWNKLEKGGVFAFRSPDRAVLVGISAPADAADADQLRRDAIGATSAEYKKPVVRPGKGRTIAGLRAEGATISGRGSAGPSSTVVAVVAGKQKAYLIEVASAGGAPAKRLVEAQLILNSLQLTK
jgi:hypothetical protein